MTTKLYTTIEGIYLYAAEQKNASHSIEDNPYHRQFAHPRLAYEFIRKYSTRTFDTKPNSHSSLLVTALIHDLSNLFSNYKGHEIVLVSMMSDIELSDGLENPFNKEIFSLFGRREADIRSISDKNMHQKIRSLLGEIYLSYEELNALHNWDKIKILILSTIPSYLETLYSENNNKIEELLNNLTSTGSKSKHIPDFSNFSKDIDDGELEQAHEYFLYNHDLVRLVKRYAYLNNADPETISKEVLSYRFSDFSSYFDINSYNLLENDIAQFLSNYSNDKTFQSRATEFIQNKGKRGWIDHQIKLGLNLYWYLIRLHKNDLLFLKESTTTDMEGVLLELITHVWAM